MRGLANLCGDQEKQRITSLNVAENRSYTSHYGAWVFGRRDHIFDTRARVTKKSLGTETGYTNPPWVPHHKRAYMIEHNPCQVRSGVAGG